jgi:recombination protein RecT
MTQMVARKDKQETIRELLDKAAPSIRAVLPKHLTVERLTKVALSVTARRPELLACSPRSLVLAVMQAAELGLDVGGLLGEAYLVPFKDAVQLIVGYRGLIKLARQSGALASVEAYTVHANDSLDLEYGLEPKLVHRPFMAGDRGDVVAAYAIARFKDGGRQVDVMTRAEVDAVRRRSRASSDGPWVTDYAEMAKKTVVRRMCKYVPLSAELARALEHEAALEEGVRSPVMDVEVFDADGVVQDVAQEPASRGDALKEKLAAKAEAKEVVS